MEPRQTSSSGQQCTSCGGSQASGWCVECVEALCEQCVAAHRRVKMTRSHTIQTRPSAEKNPLLVRRFCQIHTTEPLKLFCFPCNQLTCRDCQLMAHRNHRFQFVQQALESQKQQLDSVLQQVQVQRDSVTQTLQDLEARLQDITDHKNKLMTVLRNMFCSTVVQLKQRVISLNQDVVHIYKVEIDMIEKKAASLRDLQEKQQIITERAEKSENIHSPADLLTYRSQIQTQLRQLLSADTSPPQIMTHLNLLVNKLSYNNILTFGEVKYSTVPFSRSQPQKSSSTAPPKNQNAAGLDSSCASSGAPQTSACSVPPPLLNLPQARKASDTDLPSPASHVSVPHQSSSQEYLQRSSCSNLSQSDPPVTTAVSVHSAPVAQFAQFAPPPETQISLTKPNQSSVVQVNLLPKASLPVNTTQPLSTSVSIQASVQSNYTQAAMAIAIPSLVQTQPYNPASVLLTSAQMPCMLLTALGHGSSAVPQHFTPPSPALPYTLPGNQTTAAGGSWNSLGQLGNVTASQSQVSPASANPQQQSVVQSNNQLLNVNLMNSRAPVVNHAQPSVMPRKGMMQLLPVQIAASGAARFDKQLSTASVKPHSRPSAAATHPSSLPELLGKHQTNPCQPSKGQHTTSPSQKEQTFSASFIRSEIACQKHPILTRELLKSQKTPHGNNEINCEQDVTLSSPQPPTCDAYQPTSSPQHQLPSPTVQAVADSACDHSTPQISDSSQLEPGENDPTSTVSETETEEQVDTVPSDLPLALDDTRVSSPLDNSPCLESSEGKNAEGTVQTDPKSAETPPVSHMEPEAKSDSATVTCKNQVTTTDDMSRILQYLTNSTEIKQEPAEQEEAVGTGDHEETRSAFNPVKSKDYGTSSAQTFQETDHLGKTPGAEVRSRQADCEDQSFVDGDPECKSSHWQPSVHLFRLPIPMTQNGQPLPCFRLLPGHAKDVIYLQEIDDDDQVCSVCRSANASVTCGACGRRYHRHCHIPAVRSSARSEWSCSLCQDLSDPRDSYRSKRCRTPCLSLLDQRKCERLLLFLMCEDSGNVWRQSEPSGGASRLGLVTQRLAHRRSPPYRTPAEFVSDVWLLFDGAGEQDSEVLAQLQRSFQASLMETFGAELHPSLLKQGILGWAEMKGDAEESEGSKVVTDPQVGGTGTSKDEDGGSERPSSDAPSSFTPSDILSEDEDEEGAKGSQGSEVISAARCRPVPAGRGGESEEARLRETRKRLREFLGSSHWPSPKKPRPGETAE